MTSVGHSWADTSPLLLQDIAAPMLARDLRDRRLHSAQALIVRDYL